MTVCLLQDHLYVQYVELNQFQNEFRELANKFGENEKIIKKLSIRYAKYCRENVETVQESSFICGLALCLAEPVFTCAPLALPRCDVFQRRQKFSLIKRKLVFMQINKTKYLINNSLNECQFNDTSAGKGSNDHCDSKF